VLVGILQVLASKRNQVYVSIRLCRKFMNAPLVDVPGDFMAVENRGDGGLGVR
jgi:hypothetical protein